MAAKLIKYHPNTTDLALFETMGKYWIGSYSPFMTHQNNEPPYVFIRGYYCSLDVASDVLAKCTGDEI